MKKFSIVFKSGLTLNIMAETSIVAIKQALTDHPNNRLRDILRVSENKFSKMIGEDFIEGEILN